MYIYIYIYIHIYIYIYIDTYDVVGLYPNIPHEEGLASIRKFLNNRENKEVKTSTLVELTDIVLKSNHFQFLDKTFKQKRSTAIRTNLLHHITFYVW